MGRKKKEETRGRPTVFSNAEEVTTLYDKFLDEVGKDYTVAPTKYEFLKYLERNGKKCSRNTLYRTLLKYQEEIGDYMTEGQSSTLVQGGVKGFYNVTMAIFALKNYCGFTDKQSVQQDSSIKIDLGALQDESN